MFERFELSDIRLHGEYIIVTRLFELGRCLLKRSLLNIRHHDMHALS